MSRPLRVLHLVGSPTSEFWAELSRLYAADCLDAVADPERYETVVAHVDPDGSWRFPADLSPAARAAAEPLSLAGGLRRIRALAPDVAVPQLFCRAGMTTYRDLLDSVGVPFAGNPGDVMALGADKPRARDAVAAAGVPVPAGVVLGPDAGAALPPFLELPVVVKPADADNSSGVTLVTTDAELPEAVRAARAESDRVLIERFVPLGREVRCGVLERDGELVVLPMEEYAVDAERKPIRDAADKLRRDGGGELGLVAKTAEYSWIVTSDDPATARVAEAARTAHRALGCRHYSLFDFRIDPDGEPWFLEASLYCSFARTSVIAVMAAAAGIPVDALFADLVGLALADD
ncbi:D-alanine--D-alanine ligase family protein [Jatrophihabitans fulvus]